jgi:hypothetical protein
MWRLLLEQSGRIHSSRESLVARIRRTSTGKLFSVKDINKENTSSKYSNVLDAEQCVIFGNTLASCGSTSLDLTNTKSNGKVSNDSVFSLTATMRDHDAPTIRLRELSTTYYEVRTAYKVQ